MSEFLKEGTAPTRTEAIMRIVRPLPTLMAYNAKEAVRLIEQEVSALEADLMQVNRSLSDSVRRVAELENHNRIFREVNDGLAQRMGDWCEALNVESGLEAGEALRERMVYAVPIRNALESLVALKEIKERMEAGTASRAEHDYYNTVKEEAWDNARAALAENPNPSGQPSTEASLTCKGEASGPVGLGPEVHQPYPFKPGCPKCGGTGVVPSGDPEFPLARCPECGKPAQSEIFREPSPHEQGRATDDPLYDQAVMLVVENSRASISLVQRHLKIGYNRAARLLEAMEIRGVVSPMGADGTRSICSGSSTDPFKCCGAADPPCPTFERSCKNPENYGQ